MGKLIFLRAPMKMLSRHYAGSILFLLCTLPLMAQTTDTLIDYNRVYRYPFSIGTEIQFSTPLALLGTDYQGDFSGLDISILGHFPLKKVPQIQPLARLGVNLVKGETGVDQFSNTRIYITGGLGYAHKFNKKLEIGADLEAGAGYAIFPDLDGTGQSYGAWNMQASLGGRFAFNPSYNFSIDLHPALRYYYSLSPLVRFNGFSLTIGISGHYRFGTDPDDPRAEIRSIEFNRPQVDDMFAAMQSYYTQHPAGNIMMTNTERYPLTDVTVTFFQSDYMNLPTEVFSVSALEPGESLEVPITVNYDQRVFGLEGVMPLTGEIQVDYTLRTRTATQSIPVNYDLYDKNSLTWDDDRKVAAFITSGDSALSNYLSFLRQSCKDEVNPGFNEEIQTGMQIFYGLTEIGLIYQRDRVLSFEDAQGDKLVVDTVSLPRETLTNLFGDCDDLTVLFNAMMESAGIETGFITVPGHIYSMFSTGVPAKDFRLIHPDKSMTVPIEGVLWVPLEITFIGENDFDAAWRAGAEEYNRFVDDEDKLGQYFTRDAQQTYRPVGFEERDLGLQYGNRTNVARSFRQALSTSTRQVLEEYEAVARDANSKSSWNQLGIVSAVFQDYDGAEKAFYSALSLDRNYIPPKINLANVYFKREEYQNALRLYHEAEQRLRETGNTGSRSYARLLLNISKTYHEVENFDQAAVFSERLSQVNPELADRYAYLADGSGARAADISAGSDILFVEE